MNLDALAYGAQQQERSAIEVRRREVQEQILMLSTRIELLQQRLSAVEILIAEWIKDKS